MTVLMHDVAGSMTTEDGELFEKGDLAELLYTDDTMLIGKRAFELNILIAAIEKESAKYNLKLKLRCYCQQKHYGMLKNT